MYLILELNCSSFLIGRMQNRSRRGTRSVRSPQGIGTRSGVGTRYKEHQSIISVRIPCWRYLEKVWIYPRESRGKLPAGMPWILFETPNGAYTPQWMLQAAIDRIQAKIRMYQGDDIRGRHSLGEFDLLCFYCDEALLHNTPIHAVGFGFQQLAAELRQALSMLPKSSTESSCFTPTKASRPCRSIETPLPFRAYKTQTVPTPRGPRHRILKQFRSTKRSLS